MQLTFTSAPSSQTPINYIGGKKILYNRILHSLPDDTRKLVSPFFGGGGLEIQLAATGIRVYGYDIFEPISQFFTTFNGHSSAVVSETLRLYPLSHEEFLEYSKGDAWKALRSPYTKAAVFWLGNKMSFSGRGFSTTPARTNNVQPEYFQEDRWQSWRNDYLTVERQDWRVTLDQHPDDVLYVDPPYVGRYEFYGWKGGQPPFDHEELRDALAKRDAPWILSYAPDDLIFDLYRDFTIHQVGWTHSAGNNAGKAGRPKGKELLIVNKIDLV